MSRLLVLFVFVQFIYVVYPTEHLARFRRIIGGHDVREGEWPWLVHLKGRIPSKVFWGIPLQYKTFYCGGSIINKYWVLTAAHCFQPPVETNSVVRSRLRVPKYWHITAGEIKRTHSVLDTVKSLLGDWFHVTSWQMYYEHAARIVLHPEYKPLARELWPNDIALVKVTKELPIGVSGRNIDSIEIGEKSPVEGSTCTVKGWGCTVKGGSLPEIAKAVSIPVQNNSMCNRLYGMDIGEARLCAGPVNEHKGICAGDSGGPLVCEDGTGSWYQTALASFTSGSHPSEVPGVYTRLSEYIDWIERVINTY